MGPRARRPCGLFTLLGVVALMGVAGPALAATTTTATTSLASVQSPTSEIIALLDMIYRLIGGDPRELDDLQLSMTTRMNMVRGQYETCGIPLALTAAEHEELLDTILLTHQLLQNPLIPLLAGERAVLLFDSSLHDMWDELGGEPGALLDF